MTLANQAKEVRLLHKIIKEQEKDSDFGSIDSLDDECSNRPLETFLKRLFLFF